MKLFSRKAKVIQGLSLLTASRNLLSWIMHQFGKWLFPAVHFYNLHAIDNLAHQPDPPVSLFSCLHSKSPKLFSNPGCNVKVIMERSRSHMSDTYIVKGQRRSGEPPPQGRRDRSCSRGWLWWWQAGGARPRGSDWTGRQCQTCKISLITILKGFKTRVAF